ncbi:MAG TPA: SIMPL domain-containing protein [Streptosporangiaceae bacterium]|nr:SIMPL domain-containing protein [Streptosporangiaceae bacterium]
MAEHARVPEGPGAPAPVVSVRGEATVEAPPEIARMWVTVAAEDRDRRAALEKLSRRNAEVLSLVKSCGDAVERAETGGLSVYPVLRGRRGGESKRGEEKVRYYHGTVRTRVTVGDFTVLGELAGRLADMEMTDLEGPWWGLRPDSPVYRHAREDAAREAVTRAAQYARAVGGQLTALLELADTGLIGEPVPRRMVSAKTAAARPAVAAEPPVLDLEPETQTVRAQVEARFTMTQPAVLEP